MGVSITTKVRNWKKGEATERVQLSDKAEREYADLVTSSVNKAMQDAGRVPVTINVQINVEATVLAPPVARTTE